MPSEEEPSITQADAELESPLSAKKSYLLPYNNVEIQRLDAQQKMLSEIYEGRVVVAPVNLKEGSEVLDVATGSGAWAFDFIERHPAANATKITCVDINASMFRKARPSNLSFQIASALAMPTEWTNKFAFVHQRLLLSGITYQEWEQDIREIYRVTQPGGWAQLCETSRYHHMANGTGYKSGPAHSKTMKLVSHTAEKNGMDLLCVERIPGLMEAAGFVDVRKEERIIPLGAWNGDLSRRVAENLATVFRGYKGAVLKQDGLGIIETGEEYDALIDETEREWAAGMGGHDSYVVFIGTKIE